MFRPIFGHLQAIHNKNKLYIPDEDLILVEICRPVIWSVSNAFVLLNIYVHKYINI